MLITCASTRPNGNAFFGGTCAIEISRVTNFVGSTLLAPTFWISIAPPGNSPSKSMVADTIIGAVNGAIA